MKLLFDKKLIQACFLIVFLSQAGCITMQKLRIKNEASVKKRPVIGCVETALYKFKDIGFKEFKGTCVTQLRVGSDGLTQCIPTYRYDYRIPAPSRDEGFFASILVELSEDKNTYENFFYSNDNLSESEKQIVINTLAKVDSHINKECGTDLSTKLSVINE